MSHIMTSNETKTYTLRLSVETIGEICAIGAAQHIPPRTLARAWLLQRLDAIRAAETETQPQQVVQNGP